MRSGNSVSLLLSALALISLAGCGQKQQAQAPKKVESIVYASLGDCVSAGRLEAAVCDRIIEQAVSRHEKSATRYRNLAACEKAEGAGLCERAWSGDFLPRPSAFHVTFGPNPSANVMYFGKPGDSGERTFRLANGRIIAADGDVPLSNQARQKLSETKASRNRRG